MKKLLLILLSALLLFGCGNQTENVSSNEDIDNQEVEEVYTREITEEEQQYIDLVLKDDFDTLYSLTENKLNEVQEDYYRIAHAFKKHEDAKIQEDKEYPPYTSIYLKYSTIVEKLEELKYIPNELQGKVNELLKISLEKKEHYYALKEEEKAQMDAERIKNQLKKDIEKRTKNPQPVHIGMTKEEVLTEGWGRPKDINKTTTVYGVSEQWVYSGYKYLYFEDGILTAIQE